MPLRPNFIERFLIGRGAIPGLLVDGALPSFMVAALVGAGEVGLFRALQEGPVGLETLADRTGCDRRALANLLGVLEPLGYVERGDGEYGLTSYTEESFPVDRFHEMVPFIREQCIVNLKGVGTALREAPDEGIMGWDSVKGGEVGRSYQVTMRWLAGSTVEEVTRKVDLPDGAARMIDVGGSHGLYSVEMCRKYPGLRATVLDWPIGVESTRETLEQEPDVAGRIDTHEADFNEDEIPTGYDYTFLGNIVHGNSPEQNRRLLGKLAAATTDRGTVGILDQFDDVSGSRFTRSVASLIGWNLFLFSNGRAYAVDEVQCWLEEAGFPEIRTVSLRKTPGFTLLLGRK